MTLTPDDLAQIQAMIAAAATVGEGFATPIVAGQQLLIPSIQSPGFVSGATGWSIMKNGAVEFNNGTFRGTLSANSLTAGSIGSTTITGSTLSGDTITDPVITFDSVGGVLLIYGSTTVKQSFFTSGTFNVPAGTTSLKVEAIGAGNGGQGAATGSGEGDGGPGGEYACEPNLAVTGGGAYPFTVGQGGPGGAVGDQYGAAGTASVFAGDAVTVTANAPAAGQSLGASGSTNTIHFPGGNGGLSNYPGSGAGGGSSGGQSSAGRNGASVSGGGSGGLGGAAPAGGGNGGHGVSNTGTNGTAGAVPGGGGGGGGASATAQFPGTAGGWGVVTVTYLTGRTLIGSIASVSGADTYGPNSYPAGFMGGIVAVSPTAVPNVPEAWHAIPLAATFTAGAITPKYRLMPDGMIELEGEVTYTPTAATSILGLSFSTAIPSAYWPAVGKNVNCYLFGGTGTPTAQGGKTPFVGISAAGVLSVGGFTSTAAIGDTVFFGFEGRYSLTNP
jgi:hypothetical protein